MKANAKINIFLRIRGIMPEGYHDLYMLMQEIDLADDVEILWNDDGKGTIFIESEADCEPEKDLCYKAAAAYYARLGANNLPSITIKETKNTPSQAGLGGGSSDAALILKEMQKRFGNPFSYDEMIDLAKSIGADVPFFLVGGSCICEGIGEIITPLPSLGGLPMILVKPSEGVPTGPCFKLSDSRENTYSDEYMNKISKIFEDESLSATQRLTAAKGILVNDLQEPAQELVPRIKDLVQMLGETKPIMAAMSGSGSCVFAIYESESDRDSAVSRVEKDPRSADCRIFRASTV